MILKGEFKMRLNNSNYITKTNEILKDTRFFVCSETSTDVSEILNEKLSQSYGKIQMCVVPESKMKSLYIELQYIQQAKSSTNVFERDVKIATALETCGEFGFEILSDNKDNSTVSLNAFSNSADSCVLNTTVEEQTIGEAIETINEMVRVGVEEMRQKENVFMAQAPQNGNPNATIQNTNGDFEDEEGINI